ncbi:MAG: hypothetical protein K1X74_04575 [Pirellulales bacterium]|nr:hypothetical protein [Pirellulales bacterium]
MTPAGKTEIRPLHVALFVGAFAVVVLGMETVTSAWLGVRGDAKLERPAYMVDVGRDAKTIPPAISDRPTVLLLGNSQMYSLAGRHRGEPLRNETTSTLFDQFVQRVDGYLGSHLVTYYRLAYPNQLPFEYLTTYCDLLSRGYRPNVVVMAWNWPNIARERDLRHSIHLYYKRPEYISWLVGHLENLDTPGSKHVLAAVQAEIRKARIEIEKQDAMSDADKLDHEAVDWLAEHTTLVGQSSEIRSRIYRSVVNGFQERVVQNVEGYQRGVIEADLEFNQHCLSALLALMSQYRAKVLIYEEPVRGDMASFVETSRHYEVLSRLVSVARGYGFDFVDAREVVPNEYWGWAGNYPDRGHFTETGHELLAEFLFQTGKQCGLWDHLKTGVSVDDAQAFAGELQQTAE